MVLIFNRLNGSFCWAWLPWTTTTSFTVTTIPLTTVRFVENFIVFENFIIFGGGGSKCRRLTSGGLGLNDVDWVLELLVIGLLGLRLGVAMGLWEC